MKIHFGLRIRELRESKGVSKTSMARSINVSKAAIGQWESGEVQAISGENLLSAADYFDVSPFYILRGTGSKSSPADTDPGIELFLTILEIIDGSLADERIYIATKKKVEMIRVLYDYYRSSGEYPRDKSQVVDLVKFKLSLK